MIKSILVIVVINMISGSVEVRSEIEHSTMEECLRHLRQKSYTEFDTIEKKVGMWCEATKTEELIS